MTASTEVAPAPSAVPALVSTPALEITAEDVALPRIYLGQFMSGHVQEQTVPAGCIFTATGQDDPDPQVLWELDADKATGPLFYVLGLRKGKSITVDGELETFAYDDPNAPADAWVTYNYFVALPEVDTDVPYKFLMTRTARPAAQQINTVLAKNVAKGPPWVNAFRVTSVERKNPKGKYFVPRISVVEPDDKHVAAAEVLATMIAGRTADVQARGEEPAI
jgi:hypothetical protein